MSKNNRLLQKLAQRAKIKNIRRERFRKGGRIRGWLDSAQDALTVGGMLPGVGIIPDLINTGVSGARAGWAGITGDKAGMQKHLVQAGLNAAASIPIAGQGVSGAKLGAKYGQKVLKTGKKAKSTLGLAEDAQAVKGLVDDAVGPPKNKQLGLLSNEHIQKNKEKNPFMMSMPDRQFMQDGGYMNKMSKYTMGGEMVPGGMVAPIPGSDAVEFIGNQHDEAGMGSDSGILLDDNTEVEGGETMDQVTMAKHGGQRRDYFFSDHLKKDGKSYAEHHKDILRNGGSQRDIDLLARMQEHAAGRDVNKVAKDGGVKQYGHGGEHPFNADGSFVEGHEWMTNPEDFNFDNPTKTTRKGERTADISKGEIMGPDGTIYDMQSGKVIYQDINGDGIDDQTQGITTYHNIANDLTRMLATNPEMKKQIQDYEKLHNVKFDVTTNTFLPVNAFMQTTDTDGTDEGFYEGTNIPLSEDPQKVIDAGYTYDSKTNKYVKTDTDNTDTSNKGGNVNTASVDDKDEGLSVASDVYLPDYGDIPSYQPGVNINDMQYYMDDPELQKYITEHEDFGSEWMSNIDPEVLESAGITDFSQMNDPENVKKYQEAWNAKYPDNQIQVDGDFGEQTIRTGFKAVNDGDGEEVEDKGGDDTKITGDLEEPKKKRDWSGLVGLSQFIPAAMAMFEKPDKMKKSDLVKNTVIVPERMAKVRLERVDYNDQLSRNAADANALNRFIETSGGGPASVINRMAAYGKKQAADMQIKAQETRANTAIANQEAGLEAQRRQANAANTLSASQANADMQQKASIQNIANEMYVDEFNAAANAATKDRRLMAVDNAVKGLAQLHADKLQYKAQERLATAISGQTGVYSREAYGQDLLAAGYEVGSPEYNALMKNFNLRNKPVIPPKNTESDDKKDDAKTGGYLKRMGGYRKKLRYGK